MKQFSGTAAMGLLLALFSTLALLPLAHGSPSAALRACQAKCNKVDLTKYQQVKTECRHTGVELDQCFKGFKLGVSIGCDFVCDAHIEGGGVPSVMSEPVRAARDASCPGGRAACVQGFDAGVRAYFEGTGYGGPSLLWTTVKLVFYVVTHPKVKHRLPEPAQRSLYRIEKAVAPATRQAKRQARSLTNAALQHAERAMNAVKASRRKMGSNPHGLPGALEPFGSLFLHDDDVAGASTGGTSS